LDLASSMTPRFGGDVRAAVSVPLFHENFNLDSGLITNDEINLQIKSAINKLIN
jgi:hypothetical protein